MSTDRTDDGVVATGADRRRRGTAKNRYVLEEQVGFILRQVSQRHAAIFARHIGEDLTATQWAALSTLGAKGACSQNQLGRLTAMDVATIKGVVDRLARRGLAEQRPDPKDGRRLMVTLTEEGKALAARAEIAAREITRLTLEPLDSDEQAALIGLLKKLR